MESNKELVQKIYLAFSVGDFDTAFGYFDKDIEWTEAAGFPYGGVYRGREQIMDGVFRNLGAEWDGWAAVPGEFIADTDTVVVIGEYTGTCVSTGKSLVAPYVHVWKLRNEKAVSFTQHTDTYLVKEAMKAG